MRVGRARATRQWRNPACTHLFLIARLASVLALCCAAFPIQERMARRQRIGARLGGEGEDRGEGDGHLDWSHVTFLEKRETLTAHRKRRKTDDGYRDRVHCTARARTEHTHTERELAKRDSQSKQICCTVHGVRCHHDPAATSLPMGDLGLGLLRALLHLLHSVTPALGPLLARLGRGAVCRGQCVLAGRRHGRELLVAGHRELRA